MLARLFTRRLPQLASRNLNLSTYIPGRAWFQIKDVVVSLPYFTDPAEGEALIVACRDALLGTVEETP